MLMAPLVRNLCIHSVNNYYVPAMYQALFWALETQVDKDPCLTEPTFYPTQDKSEKAESPSSGTRADRLTYHYNVM